jgi:hypothetical protein
MFQKLNNLIFIFNEESSVNIKVSTLTKKAFLNNVIKKFKKTRKRFNEKYSYKI